MRAASSAATALCLAAAFSVALPRGARADIDFRFRGYLSSDARFSLPGLLAKPKTGEHPRFLRNETELNLRTDITAGRHVLGVADVTVVFTGKRDTSTFADLSLREKGDPLRIESKALYVTFRDIGLEGLDLSIGRMVLQWGTGDMFNPTRNLNALDVEDPLEFGESIANQMLVLKWSPGWTIEISNGTEDDTIFDELFFEVAAVPVFRGALLPAFGEVGFTQPKYARGRYHSDLMADLFDLQDAFASQGGPLSFDVDAALPSLHLRNVQVGARAGFNLLGVDLSVSYYRGFDDFPRPETVYVDDVHLPMSPAAASSNLMDIIGGMCPPGEMCLDSAQVNTHLKLSYPRIQVVGVDFATSLDFMGGVGLWAEAAFVFHDALELHVRTPDALIPIAGQEISMGVQATEWTVEEEAGMFIKAVVGLDYSFTSWWYVNAQYLHGFVDEFGQSSLKDYVVVGSDLKFFDQALLVRIFAIVCLQDGSTILFPKIAWNPFAATELSVGGLFYVGGDDTTLGSPLTGPNMMFLKGKLAF